MNDRDSKKPSFSGLMNVHAQSDDILDEKSVFLTIQHSFNGVFQESVCCVRRKNGGFSLFEKHSKQSPHGKL